MGKRRRLKDNTDHNSQKMEEMQGKTKKIGRREEKHRAAK